MEKIFCIIQNREINDIYIASVVVVTTSSNFLILCYNIKHNIASLLSREEGKASSPKSRRKKRQHYEKKKNKMKIGEARGFNLVPKGFETKP